VTLVPLALHTAVQKPLKTLLSRLLLYDLEPSQASFALHIKPLLMTLLRHQMIFIDVSFFEVSIFIWFLPS
jgi:hypothetical protein